MKTQFAFKFLLGAVLITGLITLGVYGCGGEDGPGGNTGDGDTNVAGNDDDDNSSCAIPCKSDLDCPFGEKCECPSDTPNCRLSEMCCTGGDNNGEPPPSCESDFDCEAGYECVEVAGMDGKHCVPIGGGPDPCETNEDCNIGEICVAGKCVAQDSDCAPGTVAMIATSQDELVFQDAQIGVDLTLNLVISNEGTCPLKISSVSFENASSEEFTCERCSPNKELYPMLIPESGSTVIGVTTTPVEGVEQWGALLISSSDPDYPIVRIALSSVFKGYSILKVSPPELAFGHVNMGDSATKYLTVSNAGKGNAVMKVKSIYTYRSMSDFNNLVLQDPVPLDLVVGSSTTVDVTFTPTAMDTFEETLIVEVDGADNPDDELIDGRIMEIPMTGASVTGGNLRIDPNYIDFGEIPADQEVTEVIKICNDGGKNVTPGFYWDSLSDPYFDNLNPNKIGIIPGGGCFFLNVTYKPDASDSNTWGDHRAVFHITAEEPLTDVPIEMVGIAVNPIINEALKIEMTYDNNSTNWATGDLRRVSLIYISQKYGFCDEIDPKPDWNEEGRPRWSKIGNDCNPQFVFHASGFEDDLINMGLFDVMVSYDEDCASIPVDILAQVLNIGPDLLISYLSGGLIPPGMIDLDLGNMCMSHKSSNVNVTAYINGQVASAKGIKLDKEGDDETAFTFHRTGGKWQIY